MADLKKFSNNGTSTLLANFNIGATTCSVQAGHGARMPTVGANEEFRFTLRNAAGNIEICKCTQRTVDTFNVVVRAQEGTTERNWLAGDLVEARLTKETMESFSQVADSTLVHLAGTETITGAKTFTAAQTFNKEFIVNDSSSEISTNHTFQRVGADFIYHVDAGSAFVWKIAGTGASAIRMSLYGNGGFVGNNSSGTEATGGNKGPGTANFFQVYEDGNRVWSDSTQSTQMLAKVWVRFNGASGAVIASYGLRVTTPIVKNGTGDYTIYFLNNFTSSTSFVGTGSATNSGIPAAGSGCCAAVAQYAPDSVRVSVNDNNTDINVDMDEVAFVLYGS